MGRQRKRYSQEFKVEAVRLVLVEGAGCIWRLSSTCSSRGDWPKVVGWAAADHMRSELVEEALKRALATRQPQPGLISHSDRGSQYTSRRYQDLLDEHLLIP